MGGGLRDCGSTSSPRTGGWLTTNGRLAHHERAAGSPRTGGWLTTNGRLAHHERAAGSPRMGGRLTTNVRLAQLERVVGSPRTGGLLAPNGRFAQFERMKEFSLRTTRYVSININVITVADPKQYRQKPPIWNTCTDTR